MHDLEQELEAVLFAHGEGVKISELAAQLEAGHDEIEAALDSLAESLAGRGIRLLRHGGTTLLVSAPEHAERIASVVNTSYRAELTSAMLEVLAIVAYRGEASETDISYLRGIHSTFTVRNLLIRGLIERVDDVSGPMRYRGTTRLLQYLGVTSFEDIPDYAIIKEQLVETSDTRRL